MAIDLDTLRIRCLVSASAITAHETWIAEDGAGTIYVACQGATADEALGGVRKYLQRTLGLTDGAADALVTSALVIAAIDSTGPSGG